MECVPCRKTFSGRAPYEQHIASEKHKRKAISYTVLNNAQTSAASLLSKRNVVNDGITCDACDITFDSAENFQKHALSLEHAEKVLNYKSSLNCNVVSSSELKMNVDDDSNNHVINDTNNENKCIDPILNEFEENKKPQFYMFSKCDVCDKQFSGPEPYRQHIESASHLKKIEMQNGTLQNAFSCEPCKKSFTGRIPYMQHLSSEVHKKKIENLQFLEKETPIETQNLKMMQNALKTDGTFCVICNVYCSGAIPYQQHLSGSTHLKNKAKQQNISSKNFDQCTTIQQFNNCENSMMRNGFQNGDHLNGKMKADYILPELMNDLEVMSTEEFENSITMFSPDEEINFD